MAEAATLKRRATIAGQDRDLRIRQRQDAEERLEALVEQIAKAKPENGEDLFAEYGKARDAVEALAETVELVSHWADDAQIAVAEAELDQATAAAQKTFAARREHRGQMVEHGREMLRLANKSHPQQAELEGAELDKWRQKMMAKAATLKVKGQQVQRDHNRAALRKQTAEQALAEVRETLGVSATS